MTELETTTVAPHTYATEGALEPTYRDIERRILLLYQALEDLPPTEPSRLSASIQDTQAFSDGDITQKMERVVSPNERRRDLLTTIDGLHQKEHAVSEERRALQAELQDLDAHELSRRVATLRSIAFALRAEQTTQQQNRARLTDAEAKLGEQTARLDAIRQTLEGRETALEEGRAYVHEQAATLRAQGEALAALQATCDERKAQIDQERLQLDDLRLTLTTLEAHLRDHERRLERQREKQRSISEQAYQREAELSRQAVELERGKKELKSQHAAAQAEQKRLLADRKRLQKSEQALARKLELFERRKAILGVRQDEVAQLRALLDAKAQALETREAEFGSQRDQHAAMDEQAQTIERLVTQKSELDAKLRRLQEQGQQASARRAEQAHEYAEQIQALQIDLALECRRLEALTEEKGCLIQTQTEALEVSRIEIEEERGQLTVAREQLAAEKRRIQEQSALLEIERRTVQDAQSQVQAAESSTRELAELRSKLEGTQTQLNTLTQRAQSAEVELAAQRESARALQAQIAEQTPALDAAVRERNLAQERIDKFDSDQQRVLTQVHQLQHERNTLRAELERVQQAQKPPPAPPVSLEGLAMELGAQEFELSTDDYVMHDDPATAFEAQTDEIPIKGRDPEDK